MAVNVNGAAGSLGFRSLCATSTGRLWQVLVNGTTLQMWYSDDSGATWSENTSARITGVDASGTPCLFIDQDGHAHVIYSDTSGAEVYYARMGSVGVSSAWATPRVIDNASGLYAPLSMIVHREGTGWYVHALDMNTSGSTLGILHRQIPVLADGTYAGTIPTADTVASATSADLVCLGIDFHHTAADVTATADSAPHLYVAWIHGADLKFVKATYSAGTWSWGTTRTLDSSLPGSYGRGSMIFDGERVLAVARIADSSPACKLWERDAADTTTTARAIASVTIECPAVTYDGNGDVWIIGDDDRGSGGNILYKVYDRSAGTWGTETTLEAETPTDSLVAVRRGGGYDVDASWGISGSVRFERTGAPHPPTAATWVTPVDFAGADVGASLVLDWAFNDPYPSDTQGKYAVRRQIGAGTLYYWRASDSTWQTSETANVSATTSLTLSSGWGSDGDDNHKFAVKTWDSVDAVGVYSAELTVVPSAPDNPTITTPTDSSTHVTSSLTAVWTVTSQTTYLVELLNAAGTSVLWSSGTQTSTSVRSQVIAYTLATATSYKARVTTAQLEGLVGTADTNSFSVAYTAPATPTLTVTANTPTGAITVAHANPTPTGSQPTVTSCDVFVRCTAGNYPDGDRPVGGNGIRIKASLTPGVDWIDYAPASGRAYEYMVRAYGDNGTTTDSAWTS